MSLTHYITMISQGKALSIAEAEAAFTYIMTGNADDSELKAFLLALKDKGEAASEITGAARVLREYSLTLNAPKGTIDTCGTGGDGKHSLNVSTAVAIIVASCGINVAKHGNRSVSSKCGSADVLETIGINIDADIPTLERCLKEQHICFMMAPHFHPAMKHVSTIRKELGTRTIFNLLGPLCNPAATTYQLLGVYDSALITILAEALRHLGIEKAWVVHGADGSDEITISNKTYVAALENGSIEHFTITPEDAGLKQHLEESIKGGDAQYNANALSELLAGKESSYRDTVLLNSAAALVIAGAADDLQSGAALAAQAIDDGRARATLDGWKECSNA